MRELRRPWGGGPLAVGLDLTFEGTRLAVDRDLAGGTVRVVERDRGVDRTAEFLRPGGRDVVGERLTGLTEPLLRTTAYVSQNVLEGDALDSALTLELARIADAGGGEASVVRALRALDGARARMPDAVSGPTVSVETEVVRTRRRAEERRAEASRRRVLRDAAAAASSRLEVARKRLAAARRRASLLEAAVAAAEREALGSRLASLRDAAASREALEAEAEAISRDTLLLEDDALAAVDALRQERGTRPERLARALGALAREREELSHEAAQRARRFGPLGTLPEEARRRLARLLAAAADSEVEVARAEGELEAQWDELRREGLAEDLKRLDSLPAGDRDFLHGVEEERRALELSGVQADRRAAEAIDLGRIVVSERKVRVAAGRRLVAAGLFAAVLSAALWLSVPRVPGPAAAAASAFAVALAATGSLFWAQGRRHRSADEEAAREAEGTARAEAAEARRRLSELRLRLDQVARLAGFAEPGTLTRAHRRARASDEKRRALIERSARRDAALARRMELETELLDFREALGGTPGLPSAGEAKRLLGVLEDVDRALRAAAAKSESVERDAERLAEEEAAIADLERRLRSTLERAGLPPGLPLAEGLMAVESARRRASRRKAILELELPARRDAASSEDVEELARRVAALDAEVLSRLGELGAGAGALPALTAPEEARRSAEAARLEERAASESLAELERELAGRVREASERAREGEEALAEAEAAHERAVLFREALDLARTTLSEAASSAYGDFRRGLSDAAAAILKRWRLPYEAMEFGDDLSVTVSARGGRVLTRAELDAAVSTGAREQIHLVARLAALRYLGGAMRGVPLLLDDPLVGSDDARFRAAMELLLGPVLDERPVLVATCHGWRHERLLADLPPELRLRLSVVSLRGMGASAAIDGGSAPP